MRSGRPPITPGYTRGWRFEPPASARVVEPLPEGRDAGRYVELHCHSCFSLREGASTPQDLVLQARRLSYTALALTDHDSLAGAMQFA